MTGLAEFRKAGQMPIYNFIFTQQIIHCAYVLCIFCHRSVPSSLIIFPYSATHDSFLITSKVKM